MEESAYSPRSPKTVFWCRNRLFILSLHPSLLPPTLSYAPSVARHVTDELQESMSVCRKGGEKRNTKEDIRKNSFSEFLGKERAGFGDPWVFGTQRGVIYLDLADQPRRTNAEQVWHNNKHLSLHINGLLSIHSSTKTNVTVYTAPAVEDAVAMRLLLTCIAPLW